MSSFPAISWREQDTVWCDDRDDDLFILDYHTKLDFYTCSARLQKQQCASSTRTHYSVSGPTNVCSFSLLLRGYQRNNKYQFCNLWFDPNGTRTHDLSNPRSVEPTICRTHDLSNPRSVELIFTTITLWYLNQSYKFKVNARKKLEIPTG